MEPVLEDRVLLVTAYWRTDLTLRQFAPRFGVSKSAADRIIKHPGPLLASKVRRRFAWTPCSSWTAPWSPPATTRWPSGRRTTTAPPTTTDTRRVVVVGRPLPGNRNDCRAWALSRAKAAVGRTTVIGGGYRGTAHRRSRRGTALAGRTDCTPGRPDAARRSRTRRPSTHAPSPGHCDDHRIGRLSQGTMPRREKAATRVRAGTPSWVPCRTSGRFSAPACFPEGVPRRGPGPAGAQQAGYPGSPSGGSGRRAARTRGAQPQGPPGPAAGSSGRGAGGRSGRVGPVVKASPHVRVNVRERTSGPGRPRRSSRARSRCTGSTIAVRTHGLA